jgi:hypothetical protein
LKSEESQVNAWANTLRRLKIHTMSPQAENGEKKSRMMKYKLVGRLWLERLGCGAGLWVVFTLFFNCSTAQMQ